MMPTKRSRQGGRILPQIALRRERPARLRFDLGCVICGRPNIYVVENDRPFCYAHSPGIAEWALANPGRSYRWWPAAPLPDQRTAERILRLAGRTKPSKGKRSKQKRAPRRRARWR